MKKKQELNIQSLITNRRYLVFSILSGIISLLVLTSGIIPQINGIFDTQREISQGQEKLSSLRQKTQDLENIEAREAFSSVESVNRILPSKKPLLELLSALNLVAGRNNVSFVDLSLSPGKIASESAEFIGDAKTSARKRSSQQKSSDKGYDTLTVELEVSGLFSKVQQFFEDIEKVAPLITITSLSLDIKSDDIIRPTDEVQAEIVLDTYYFTQAVKAGLSSNLPDIGSKEQEIIAEINSYLYPTVSVGDQIEGGGLEDLFGLSLKEIEETQFQN